MSVSSRQQIKREKTHSGNQNLSVTNFLTYSAPYAAMAWLGAPIHILQGVYAKYYGVSLMTLASIILFARLFDAVSDPLIGYLSDQHYHRTGTRKPFVFFGGMLLIISAYFINVPASGDVQSVEVSVAYFTFWFIALYLGMTLFEIPHAAWASELAATASDKSKIFSFRSVAGQLGMIMFYAIPLLPIFATQDITPETLKVSVISAGVLMLPLLYLCVKNTPNSSSLSDQEPSTSTGNTKKLNNNNALVQSIINNRPLLIFFGAFLAYGFGAGMWFSLIFLYVDSYLGLGEQFAKMFILSFLVGVISTPFLCKFSITLGKKTVLVAAMLSLMSSFFYASRLTPTTADFWDLIALQTLNILGAGTMMTFAPAMLSEIIDYSIWKYRTDNTATYYALFMFLAKLNVAIGGAIGLAIIGWYGFDATTTVQTTQGIQGLMLSMTWLPMVFVVIALVLIILNPITTRRHEIIRRCLDKRVIRAKPHVTLATSQKTLTVSHTTNPHIV